MKREKSKTFIGIDRKEIAKNLAVQELGRNAGLANQPDSRSSTPCDNEDEIRRTHDGLAHENKLLHEEKLQALDQEWRETDRHIAESVIMECIDQARQYTLETKAEYTRELKKSAQRRNHYKRRIAALRDKGVEVSSSALGSYGLVYALLFVFLIVESFANSFFLGMGNKLGILGGGIEAFFIAALSIVLSFSAGIGVQAINGQSITRRIAGVLGGCMFLGTAVAYHTLIAWYRGCLVYSNPDTAKADAIANFLLHGLVLPDIHSYGLAVVGVFFSCTAFIAGVHRKSERLAADYGRIAKEYELADAQLREMEKAYFASINEASLGQCEEVDARMKIAQDAGSRQRLLTLECSRIKNNFEKNSKDIQDSYAYSIELFRRSNIAVRDTPCPVYFNDRPSSLSEDMQKMDNTIMDMIEMSAKNLDPCLLKLVDIANEVKTRIRDLYEATLQEAPAFLEELRTATSNDSKQ